MNITSLATALVDIPAVRKLIAHSLNLRPLWCCDKTAHFRVELYCPQYKVHMCDDHAV
jgi:hypothetical protein